MINAKLKGVIIGDKNVIQEGEYFAEIKKLIAFLIKKGIVPIILSNDLKPERLELESILKQEYSQLVWYIADRDGTPKKPKTEAINYILSINNWNKNEVIYIGNQDIDMQMAVNAKMLFLNATWYGKYTTYGFEFESPNKIARFIEIFCLREYGWQYSISNDELEYHALGIYGTRDPEYKIYTEDAREAAKLGRGHLDFWLNYFMSSIYFSGLHDRINYISPYPGHSQGSMPTVMEESLIIFAKCFRKTYLKDLIIRHTTAKKSAYARYNREHLDCLNQLNTIMLNEYPLKGDTEERYKKSPLKVGKTVLIVDDFCTQGFSLETARVFIEQTGAKAICLSLLKTISRNYEQIVDIDKFSPFKPNKFSQINRVISHPYNKYIVNALAHIEIGSKLQEYDNWQWPNGI